MQQTEQYGFNLIETGDAFSPEPLNENTQKMAETLSENARKAEEALSESTRKMTETLSENARKAEEALSESTRKMTEALNENVRKITETLAAKGSCTVTDGAYEGTGKSPRDIEVGFSPKFLLVYGYDGLAVKGRDFGFLLRSGYSSFYFNSVELTATGFRLTTEEHNRLDKTEYYIAFS